MALTIYGIRLLIDPLDNLKPSWYPIERFEMVDPNLPPHWKFGDNKGRNLVFAFWGYESLIEDENHYEDLIEGRGDAKNLYERERGPRYHPGRG